MQVAKIFLQYRENVLTLVLRALTLGSKFVLVLFLARELSIEQLGLYGLFAASVSYGLYIVGLDYYAYTTRELLGQSKDSWASLIRDQVVFYLIIYSLALPFFTLLFTQRLLPWTMLLPFYGLLALEHVSQELYRLLVTMQKPLLANIALFFRLGAWVYGLLIYIWIWDFSAGLNLLFISWALGGLFSIFIVVGHLRNAIDWTTLKGQAVNWARMWVGLRISSRFLLSTLALRALFTLDRYFIEWYVSTEAVGIYTFYASLANGISAFIDAGVVVFQAPLIVKSFKSGDTAAYKQAIQNLQKQIGIILAIIGGLSVMGIKPLLYLIDKEVLLRDIHIYYWLLLATALWSFSMVPHYQLYANSQDKVIVRSAIQALIVFCVSAFFLVYLYEAVGVAMALALGMGVLFADKKRSIVRLQVKSN